MSKKTKYCPVCGAELDINAIICTTCGERILGDAQAKENQNTNEVDSAESEEEQKTFWDKFNKYIYIIGAIVMFLKVCVFCATHETSLPDITLPSFNFITSAKCDSKDVKELVKQIFEQNSPLYKTIDPATITSIEVQSAVPIFYDEKIKRYTCNASIVMKSAQNGFIPLYGSIDESNFLSSYLAQIADLSQYDGRVVLKNYDTMKLTVKYSSQISDGQLVVYLENTPLANPFSCENQSGCQSDYVTLIEFGNLIGFMPFDDVEYYEDDFGY